MPPLTDDRPTHLRRRATEGASFGQPAQLIRPGGSRDNTGQWVPTEPEPETLTLATLPAASLSERRQRELTEGGVQIDAARAFWTSTRIVPISADSAGDIIVYNGDRWRIRLAVAWSTDLYEGIGVRQENQ